MSVNVKVAHANAKPSRNGKEPARKGRVHVHDALTDDLREESSKRRKQDPHVVVVPDRKPCERDAPKLTRDTKPEEVWDDKDGHYIIRLGEALGVNDRYKMLDILGEGTFGKVVECFDRVERCRLAIKIIKAVPKYRHAAKIELRVLDTLKVNDPKSRNYCVRLLGQLDFRNHVCMIFDKLGSSIYDYMSRQKYEPFCIEEVQHFTYQILVALKFIHGCGLTHTDLKPENIMLDSCRCVVKGKKKVLYSSKITVIDFGSATFKEEHHTTIVSTRHYRAPEVILELGWSFQCDIWSLGCILVELQTGTVMYQTHDNMEHLAIMEVTIGKIPPKLAKRSNKKGYFDRSGTLNWPRGARDVESIRFVRESIFPLKNLVRLSGKQDESFLALLWDMFQYDCKHRLSAHELLEKPFCSEFIEETHCQWMAVRAQRLRSEGFTDED